MIKVSVIMPAYNVEDYIEKSVTSVMEQTLKEIELIIVNDASTDKTWDKIVSLKNKYGSKIIAINLEKNVRQGGARNLGIEVAVGEFISFVDSDDWIKPDMIEKFYNAIVENQADLAGTGKCYVSYGKSKVKEIGDNFYQLKLSEISKENDAREQFLFSLGGIWKNLYRRSIIINNQIRFPEGLSYEDNYFFSLYLAYVKRYVCVDEAFYYYRKNLRSTVHRKDETQLSRIYVEKMLLEEYKKRGFYDALKHGYEIMCVKRWYINTVGVWFIRLGRDGLKPAIRMGKEFQKLFPNFKSNKYYKTVIKFKDKLKIKLFEISPRLLYMLYRIKQLFLGVEV